MGFGHAIVVDDLRGIELELGRSRPIVYDRDIGLRLLYEDPESGEEHYLIRYPAGLRARTHRHTAAHTIVVLEGRLRVNHRVVGPGAYCHSRRARPCITHRRTAGRACSSSCSTGPSTWNRSTERAVAAAFR